MVEIVIRKLNILSDDDDYANLKEEDDLEINININTMPPPSNHGHHFKSKLKQLKNQRNLFLFWKRNANL